MKTAIITLPLHTNYGGLLQAYALKTALESLGNEVTVVDLKDKMPLPVWYKAPFIYASRALKKMLGPSSGIEVFRELNYRRAFPARSVHTGEFVDRLIAPRLVSSKAGIGHAIDYVTKKEKTEEKHVCRAASLKAGGVGMRYTCIIDGKESYLYYEDNNMWFVEGR